MLLPIQTNLHLLCDSATPYCLYYHTSCLYSSMQYSTDAEPQMNACSLNPRTKRNVCHNIVLSGTSLPPPYTAASTLPIPISLNNRRPRAIYSNIVYNKNNLILPVLH